MKRGNSMALDLSPLSLTSYSVCGDAAVILYLDHSGHVADQNLLNNVAVIYVYVDCYGLFLTIRMAISTKYIYGSHKLSCSLLATKWSQC